MKRMMAAMFGAVMISAVGMYAQAQEPAKPAAAGTVYYGCLVPGSEPDAFTLINAREKGQKTKDKATYKVAADPKLDVMHFVTQEVEITGTVSGTGSAAVLTATKIKRRSDYCG